MSYDTIFQGKIENNYLSHLALGGISVKWDRIFYVNIYSYLTGKDIFFNSDREYRIVSHDIIYEINIKKHVQQLLKSCTKYSLFTTKNISKTPY
jgi:hypothetical protein